MIDTVRLTSQLLMHAPVAMRELYFSPRCGHTAPGAMRPSTWVLNSPNADPSRPRLTWTAAPDGLDYLSAEISLPTLLYGSNVSILTGDVQIKEALHTLTRFVCETANTSFDLENANVSRVDFCYHWRLKDQASVYAYLSALCSASVPRMTSRITGETTVDFISRSQTVSVYSKLDEVFNRVRQGAAAYQLMNAAVGVLRLEKRYRTSSACRRLARRLAVGNRVALNLLNANTALSVLEETMRDLGIDSSIESADTREIRLREYYGPGQRYLRLLGFLYASDSLGATNLVKLGVLSRSDYYSKLSELKRAGVWLMSPSKKRLPPLRLVYSRKEAIASLSAVRGVE